MRPNASETSGTTWFQSNLQETGLCTRRRDRGTEKWKKEKLHKEINIKRNRHWVTVDCGVRSKTETQLANLVACTTRNRSHRCAHTKRGVGGYLKKGLVSRLWRRHASGGKRFGAFGGSVTNRLWPGAITKTKKQTETHRNALGRSNQSNNKKVVAISRDLQTTTSDWKWTIACKADSSNKKRGTPRKEHLRKRRIVARTGSRLSLITIVRAEWAQETKNKWKNGTGILRQWQQDVQTRVVASWRTDMRIRTVGGVGWRPDARNAPVRRARRVRCVATIFVSVVMTARFVRVVVTPWPTGFRINSCTTSARWKVACNAKASSPTRSLTRAARVVRATIVVDASRPSRASHAHEMGDQFVVCAATCIRAPRCTEVEERTIIGTTTRFFYNICI